MIDGLDLTAVLEALTEFFNARDRHLARVIAAELRGEDPRLVDQACSPLLGRNKHIAAVKRRIHEADARCVPSLTLGAQRIGRRFLLTQEALAEEIGKLSRAVTAKAKLRAILRRGPDAVEDSDPTFVRALERARAARRG